METVEASRTLRPPVTALTVFLPGGGGKAVSSPRPSALLSRSVCFGARSTMEAVPRRPSGFPPRFSPSKERGATWEAGGVQSASLPLMSRLSRLVSVDPREEMTDTSVAQRSFCFSGFCPQSQSLLGPVYWDQSLLGLSWVFLPAPLQLRPVWTRIPAYLRQVPARRRRRQQAKSSAPFFFPDAGSGGRLQG